MARIADMLRQSVKYSSGFDTEFVVRFAYHVGVSLHEGNRLLRHYGKAYAYGAGGFAVENTSRNRYKLVQKFGKCITISESGEIVVRDAERVQRAELARCAREDKIEQIRLAREERKIRNRDRFFNAGCGEACPKRGGKANSLADIGKYVGIPKSKTWYEHENRRDNMLTIEIIRVPTLR